MAEQKTVTILVHVFNDEGDMGNIAIKFRTETPFDQNEHLRQAWEELNAREDAGDPSAAGFTRFEVEPTIRVQ